MTARARRYVATPDGRGIVATAGYPDDGGAYLDIDPMTDTRGESVVRWVRGGHIYGRALSDPAPGAHLHGNAGWPIEDLADYWIEFISDDDLGAWLRGQRVDGSGEPLVKYVRIRHVWLMPTDSIPAPRAGY